MIVIMMILKTMTVVWGDREWAGESLLLRYEDDDDDDDDQDDGDQDDSDNDDLDADDCGQE